MSGHQSSFSIRLTLIAAVCSVSFLSACTDSSTAAATPPAAVEVTVQTAALTRVELTRELPGRVSANQAAEIRPQVSGIIQSRLFEEGSVVNAGDTLYQIDPAPFIAAQKTAQAAIAKAQAQLVSHQAKAKRYAQLLAINAVSQQEYDEANAAALQTAAELAAAKAQLQTADINLNYSRVLAPIRGKISQSQVTVGALVNANQAQALATITQLDPMYVDLTQASAELLNIKQQIADGQLSQNADSAKVQIQLENGRDYPHIGTLKFSEVTVSPATGTVKLRAEFANPDALLLPGMYVNARVIEGVAEQAILIPQAAVSRNHQGQATVLVVNQQQQAELRVLDTERSINGYWLIKNGISAGEQYIVEGLQKVRPGAAVLATTKAQSTASNTVVTKSVVTNPAMTNPTQTAGTREE